MSSDDKLQALQKWAMAVNSTNSAIDALHAVTGMCDGPLIESIWRLQDVATGMTSHAVGDRAEWLDWFRSENSMGAKRMEAGPVGNTRSVRSLSDLLWLIEVTA